MHSQGFQNTSFGEFPAVQQLGLQDSVAGGTDSVPSCGTQSPQAMGPKKKKKKKTLVFKQKLETNKRNF